MKKIYTVLLVLFFLLLLVSSAHASDSLEKEHEHRSYFWIVFSFVILIVGVGATYYMVVGGRYKQIATTISKDTDTLDVLEICVQSILSIDDRELAYEIALRLFSFLKIKNNPYRHVILSILDDLDNEPFGGEQ